MRKITVDRDHYNVVWNRATGGVIDRALPGLGGAMKKAMYDANDVAEYADVSRTTVVSLMTEKGFAYRKRDGELKETARKVAGLFFGQTTEELFGEPPKSKQQSEPKCTEQPALGCE